MEPLLCSKNKFVKQSLAFMNMFLGLVKSSKQLTWEALDMYEDSITFKENMERTKFFLDEDYTEKGIKD